QTPAEKTARFCIDEHFGNFARGQERRIILYNTDDACRFTFDRDVTGPAERGAAVFAGMLEGTAIFRHFVFREFALDSPRKHAFVEGVLLQHHGLAGRRPETSEYIPYLRACVPVSPEHGGYNCLHIGNPLDAVRVLARPIKTERGAPSMPYQNDPVT